MLVCYWCCPVVFSVLLASSKANKRDPAEKIADVIKNITRVNKVLRDLIHNYEHLRKTHHTKANIDTAAFRERKNKTRAINEAKILKAKNMTLSETDGSATYDEDIASDEIEDTEKGSKLKRESLKVPNKHISGIKHKETTLRISVPSKHNTSEIIFIDTHKTGLSENRKEKQIMPEIILQTTKKKTRFIIQSSRENSGDKHLTHGTRTTNMEPGENGAKTRNKKKYRYIMKHDFGVTENGYLYNTDNIEITKKTGHNRVKSTHTDTKNIKIGIVPRSEKNDSVNNDPTNSSNAINEADNENNSASSSLDLTDEDGLKKDIFKTSILRKAYGDACLKLVVRKCYKACKAVYKIACRQGCTEKFEESYDQFSRTGCITSFVKPQPSLKTCSDDASYFNITSSSESIEDPKPKKVKPSKKKSKNAKKPKKRWTHILREQDFQFDIKDPANEYLSVVCQAPKENVRKQLEGFAANTTNDGYTLNILRDKYEKACIKTSRDKCNDACTFSYKKACEKHKCTKKRLNNFKRSCKRQCKMTYKYDDLKNKGSTSSSSSSESD